MRTDRVLTLFAPSPTAVTVSVNIPVLVGVPVTGQRIVSKYPASPGGAAGSDATGTAGEHAPWVAQLGKPATEHVTLVTSSVPEFLHWKLPE
jgi:hypothetical protein